MDTAIQQNDWLERPLAEKNIHEREEKKYLKITHSEDRSHENVYDRMCVHAFSHSPSHFKRSSAYSFRHEIKILK